MVVSVGLKAGVVAEKATGGGVCGGAIVADVNLTSFRFGGQVGQLAQGDVAGLVKRAMMPHQGIQGAVQGSQAAPGVMLAQVFVQFCFSGLAPIGAKDTDGGGELWCGHLVLITPVSSRVCGRGAYL